MRYLMCLSWLVLIADTSGAFAADVDYEIARMLQQWQKRSDSLKTLRVEWTERTNNLQDSGERQPQQQRLVLVLGAANTIRLERHLSSAIKDVPSRVGKAMSAFNGKRNFQFTTPAKRGEWPRGIVWDAKEYDEVRSYQVRPWLLWARPLQSPVPALTAENLRIINKDVELSGHKCTIIETVLANGRGLGTFWVDARRDFLILRYVETFGTKTSTLNIDYRVDPQLGWIPSAWSYESPPIRVSSRNRLLRHEVDPKLPESTFELDFPVGTITFDHQRGYRELMLPNGKHRKITPEESANGFKYLDLFLTAPGGAPALPRNEGE